MGGRRLSAARVGPLREGAFTSRLHDARVAALLGIALGVSFLVCFATGLITQLAQHPLQLGFLSMPASPPWLYRVTQGVHVASGILAIPLLLLKLWTVYPQLFTWPPIRNVAHAVERAALVPLVAGSVFQLFTGIANGARWRPWSFDFPVAHYWTAWIVIGALIVHVGAKWAVARRALGRAEGEPGAAAGAAAPGAGATEGSAAGAAAAPGAGAAEGSAAGAAAAPGRPGKGRSASPKAGQRPAVAGGLDRRGFLLTAVAAAGVVTVTTIGQTLRPLKGLALLAPRRPDAGPQGVPVNKAASGAGVVGAATDPGFRLVVEGDVGERLVLSRDELLALPQRRAELTIACVEGWSSAAVWGGVPVRELVARAGGDPERSEVVVHSLQQGGRYRSSRLNTPHVRDPDTLLALTLRGEPLHIDHGYPCRLIAPNRPGVQQTKWVARVEVVRT